MKLSGLFLIGCDAMQHMEGKMDQFQIHIGGGAFDAGTSETLAKWAIRKCEKKVCSVWPWAQCPLHQAKFDKDKKTTQAPCCHKCWNKCPPYLARHKMQNRYAFANSERRRQIKEQIWEFLEEDIQCEKTKLKETFMDADEQGHDWKSIADEHLHDEDCKEGDEDCENDFQRYKYNGMQMDAVVVTPRKSKMDIALENAAECYNYEKYSDFDCHGHKEAKCCSPSCLNQGTNPKKHCDLCGCNGVCGYLHNTVEQLAKDPNNCYLLPQDKESKASLAGTIQVESAEEEEEEEEFEYEIEEEE